MSAIDLVLRYVIISVAFQLACAWAHAFQSPWPLVDAFELAPTVEDQVFKSLGIRFDPPTLGMRQDTAFYSVASLIAAARAFGSSTLTPMARTRFAPKSVRTSTGLFVTSHASGW